MVRNNSSRAAKLKRRDRCRARPLVEPLESRMVLSACGVTCELIDGHLHIHGTAADDSIAVRYDAESALVEVVGGVDEVVGQFPVADVEALTVNGLSANDQLQVDSLLSLPLTVRPEGESSASSSQSSSNHSHQSGLTSNNTAAVLISTTVPTRLSETDLSKSKSEFSGDASITLGATHTTHESSVSSAAVAAVLLNAHSDHVANSGAMPVMAPGAGGESHNHGTVYITTTAAAVTSTAGAVAISASHDPSAGSTAETQLATSNHGHNAEPKVKIESSSKLVPKRCTVTASGGVLVTSVDGKRQCDCEAKAEAAKAVKELLAGNDEAQAGPRSAALAECLPCQRSALANATDAAVCSFLPIDPAHPLSMLPLPIMEHLDGESCPEKGAATSEAQAADAEFLQGLQIVGFALLAGSVALLPTLRFGKPRKRDDEVEPAVDWLFGRLQVEPLLR
jgi:hypothetical protein